MVFIFQGVISPKLPREVWPAAAVDLVLLDLPEYRNLKLIRVQVISFTYCSYLFSQIINLSFSQRMDCLQVGTSTYTLQKL